MLTDVEDVAVEVECRVAAGDDDLFRRRCGCVPRTLEL
jgi:hypothetical protein